VVFKSQHEPDDANARMKTIQARAHRHSAAFVHNSKAIPHGQELRRTRAPSYDFANELPLVVGQKSRLVWAHRPELVDSDSSPVLRWRELGEVSTHNALCDVLTGHVPQGCLENAD